MLKTYLQRVFDFINERILLHAMYVVRNDRIAFIQLLLQPPDNRFVIIPFVALKQFSLVKFVMLNNTTKYFWGAFVFNEPSSKHSFALPNAQVWLRFQKRRNYTILQEEPSKPPVQDASRLPPRHYVLIIGICQVKLLIRVIVIILTLMVPFSCILSGVSWRSAKWTETWWYMGRR